MTYAEDTKVAAHRTRAELLTLLERHGAEAVGFQTGDEGAAITFRIDNRWVRFRLAFYTLDRFALTPAKQRRSVAAQKQAREQHVRARWRALLLVVRAKLESVEAGIEEIEEAFLAQTVLPDDQTVYAATRPGIDAAMRDGLIRPVLELAP